MPTVAGILSPLARMLHDEFAAGVGVRHEKMHVREAAVLDQGAAQRRSARPGRDDNCGGRTSRGCLPVGRRRYRGGDEPDRGRQPLIETALHELERHCRAPAAPERARRSPPAARAPPSSSSKPWCPRALCGALARAVVISARTTALTSSWAQTRRTPSPCSRARRRCDRSTRRRSLRDSSCASSRRCSKRATAICGERARSTDRSRAAPSDGARRRSNLAANGAAAWRSGTRRR